MSKPKIKWKHRHDRRDAIGHIWDTIISDNGMCITVKFKNNSRGRSFFRKVLRGHKKPKR